MHEAANEDSNEDAAGLGGCAQVVCCLPASPVLGLSCPWAARAWGHLGWWAQGLAQGLAQGVPQSRVGSTQALHVLLLQSVVESCPQQSTSSTWQRVIGNVQIIQGPSELLL